MTIPNEVSEKELWTGARNILYFIGVNGAGKSTLAHNIAERCKAHGGHVILDAEERAFDRKFMGRSDAETHHEIVSHCIALIDDWKRSTANLIIIDRWYETYITECGLKSEHVDEIEDALKESGFNIRLVNLVIGSDVRVDDYETMLARLVHTKAHRPVDWWDESRGTVEERARADCSYQALNKAFASNFPFASVTIATKDMDWDNYAQRIVDSLKLERRWRGFSAENATEALNQLVTTL
jgi:ABC-type oligopeptide transport system ATPase subunit